MHALLWSPQLLTSTFSGLPSISHSISRKPGLIATTCLHLPTVLPGVGHARSSTRRTCSAPVYPEVVVSTPSTLSKASATHQKHPAANVAVTVSLCRALGFTGHCEGDAQRKDSGGADASIHGSGSVRLEDHRCAVHAITLAGRRRSVVKDVAQVTSAAAAVDLGADAKQAAID